MELKVKENFRYLIETTNLSFSFFRKIQYYNTYTTLSWMMISKFI